MRSLWALVICVCLHSNVNADLIHVSASGTFDDTASSSSISAPLETFFLSFDVTDAVANFTPATFSNASYFLNGASVVPTADFITFYDDVNGGLFDWFFSDGSSLGFFGDQIFDSNGALIPGTYIAAGTFPFGTAKVTVTSAVPEPSSFALAGLGTIGLTIAASRRRKATV